MITVIDNFFSDKLFQAVHDEIRNCDFISLREKGLNANLEDAGDIDYPGLRTVALTTHNPILDTMIIQHIDNQRMSFTNRGYKYNQYAHLRLESDNQDDFIHTDNTDWAYLIYISKTNLDSGTKFYTEDDKEHTHIGFVQNRAVFFDCHIRHMAFNNHGTDMNDGRLTINGFCEYI
jgi:hypothetical protein|tara:strand:- start:119 stop:646 length:528 start_codon:yes stop_codon:yes gene_type:complete